ncbi:MAG: biotin/lipoyl-binding protein, partial [Paracoccaceae bacterium]
MNWGIRKHTLIGMVTVALLFLGIGVFGLFGSMAGAVVSNGQVDLETHAQVIQHPDGGVVAAIHVRDGDRVKAGDVLLSLEGNQIRSDLAIAHNQLIELQARAVRLKAEQLGQDSLSFPAELDTAAAGDSAVSEVLQGQRAVFEAGKHTFSETVNSTR